MTEQRKQNADGRRTEEGDRRKARSADYNGVERRNGDRRSGAGRRAG